MRRIILVIVGWLLLVMPLLAQASGQFCVRGFEDRNANGQIDAGEPVLTRGMGANLLNAQGIVIQTALIDNSPTSAQGVICFQNLPNGQYTMEITSAEYTPTTLDNLTVNITDDPATLTTVFEYGGQRVASPIIVAEETTESGELSDAMIERIAVSLLGAMVAMAGAALIGMIYFVVIARGRHRRAAAYYDQRRTTGSMRPVQPHDTGEWRQ